MKTKYKDTIFIILFILLLGAYLYYLFCKPVEGFFAKTDACQIANENRIFMENQEKDVTQNLTNLENKFTSIAPIRAEIQSNLTKFACLQFNTSNPTCTTLTNAFNLVDTQLNTQLANKKLNEDTIAEANTKIPQLTASINDLNSRITKLNEALTTVISCDPRKSNYAGATQCATIDATVKEWNAKIATDTSSRSFLQTQLNTATANVTTTNPIIATLTSQKQSFQTQLGTNQCTTIKNTFICNELNNNLQLIDQSIQDARKEQEQYTTFFNSKRTPIDDIKALIQNSC